jgi:hypothetical protein
MMAAAGTLTILLLAARRVITRITIFGARPGRLNE